MHLACISQVSGEDEDVWPERKPSPAIYEHAIRRASSDANCGAAGDASAADGASESELLRASWVHVGDCLVNDVRASKAAGAATVSAAMGHPTGLPDSCRSCRCSAFVLTASDRHAPSVP